MSFRRLPEPTTTRDPTDLARDLGAAYVLDPFSSVFSGVTDGTEVLSAPNALLGEYPDTTAPATGGKFVLTSTAGSGLLFDRTHAINGRPSINTDVLGAAGQKLCTTTQSPVKGADVGGLPAWNANWAGTTWTMVFAVEMLTAGPAGLYSGGFMIGKTAEGTSIVLGFATDASGHPKGFWLGTPGGGEIGGAYFDWPEATPTGVMVVSVSYDGARQRITINGADPTSTDGFGVAAAIAAPGFGFAPAFSGHGPPSSRIRWAAFFPHILPRSAVRSLGHALASALSIRSLPLLLTTGDSIASGLNLADVTAWAGDTLQAAGDVRLNGGRVYVCTHAGTTAHSGGPTGTTLTITDGTCTWAFVGINREFPNVAPWANLAMAQCLVAGKRGTIRNVAEAGAKTEFFLGPGHEFYFEHWVQSTGVSMGLVQTGTNDLFADYSSATTIANRRRLAYAMAEVGSRPIFIASILPNEALSPTQDARRLVVNADIPALVAENPTVFRPLDFAPIEGSITYGDDPATHPDQAGHEVIATYFAPILANYLA